jgi:hypothetical protein
MIDVILADERAAVRVQQQQAGDLGTEAAEVAKLLARAGVDHASSLWFQLLELASQQACDWAERSAESGAPLRPQAAAVLGLRSLAADLLTALSDEEEKARAAAEACLSICAEAEAHATPASPRRRWGEGALAQPPRRPNLLDGSVGCC